MPNIKNLENKSIYIIREAYKKFKNPAILWSAGKDSTVMLWLCKKAFFGKIPFPVMHIDTKYQFRDIYRFRDKISKELELNLKIITNKEAIKKRITPQKSRFDCCNARKTESLKQAIKKYKIDALLVGIRRDEHGIRNKEHYFSPRSKKSEWLAVKEKNNPKEGDIPLISLQDPEFEGWMIFSSDFGKRTGHVRVHPLLHWTEEGIWEYIKKENIPFINLYLAKNKKRYRSLGCECCSEPVESGAGNIKKIIKELKTSKKTERFGRSIDKENEHNMQKLRSLGYM